VHVEPAEKRSGLWTVNIDGTGANRIVANADLPAIAGCAWSPDGQHIVVVRMIPQVDDIVGIADADGKNYKELKLDDLETVSIGPPEWR
jgi:dipeptidyl aminopeptidase/acylaminoacyl peptidase